MRDGRAGSGAAARRHLRMFRSYDPAAVREGELEVPDPYYGGADGFEHVLDLVERAADGLVAELTRTVGDGGAEGSTRHGG